MGQVEAWRRMAYIPGHWTLCGFGSYAVEGWAAGQRVGRIGYTAATSWPGGIELGWMLAPAATD